MPELVRWLAVVMAELGLGSSTRRRFISRLKSVETTQALPSFAHREHGLPDPGSASHFAFCCRQWVQGTRFGRFDVSSLSVMSAMLLDEAKAGAAVAVAAAAAAAVYANCRQDHARATACGTACNVKGQGSRRVQILHEGTDVTELNGNGKVAAFKPPAPSLTSVSVGINKDVLKLPQFCTTRRVL